MQLIAFKQNTKNFHKNNLQVNNNNKYDMKNKQILMISAALCVVATLRAWRNKRKLQRKKRKQWWIRPGLRNRVISGFYATLRTKLALQDARWLKNFLHMTMEDFDVLVERLTPYISKKNTSFRQAISVGERLAVTLRYLATGDSFSNLMRVFLIGKTTICHIIHETCGAIYNALKDEFLNVPSTPQEWKNVADVFEQRWNFPNCCGALDGKHIAIQQPANFGPEYSYGKKYNNIVLMAMVDADYKFLFVDVEAYGPKSDEGVFARCQLSTALADNTINFPPPKPLPHEVDPMPFCIVADDAFPLKLNLLKPFSYCEQMMSHKIFNYRLSRARNVVDNAFGICASRFKILRRPMDVTTEHAKAIVLAVCVLHNFLLTRKSIYMQRSDVDDDRNGVVVHGNWRMELGENEMLTSIWPSSATDILEDNAINVREKFMEYFMAPHGELEWQYNKSILNSSQD